VAAEAESGSGGQIWPRISDDRVNRKPRASTALRCIAVDVCAATKGCTSHENCGPVFGTSVSSTWPSATDTTSTAKIILWSVAGIVIGTRVVGGSRPPPPFSSSGRPARSHEAERGEGGKDPASHRNFPSHLGDILASVAECGGVSQSAEKGNGCGVGSGEPAERRAFRNPTPAPPPGPDWLR